MRYTMKDRSSRLNTSSWKIHDGKPYKTFKILNTDKNLLTLIPYNWEHHSKEDNKKSFHLNAIQEPKLEQAS